MIILELKVNLNTKLLRKSFLINPFFSDWTEYTENM